MPHSLYKIVMELPNVYDPTIMDYLHGIIMKSNLHINTDKNVLSNISQHFECVFICFSGSTKAAFLIKY